MQREETKLNALEKYFQDFEREIISMVAERLYKISGVKHDDLDNLLELQNITGDLQVIRKKLAETVDKAKSAIYNDVEEYARVYFDEAEKKYDGRLAPFEKNLKILALVERAKRDSFKILSQVLNIDAIGFENDGEFKFLEQAYREIINEVIVKARRNDEDLDEFIETVLERLAERGLLKYEI